MNQQKLQYEKVLLDTNKSYEERLGEEIKRERQAI